jgi:Ni/Fe-hydrogenase subunit HybB-like protein
MASEDGNIETVVASAVLISAWGIARPLFYGLVNGPYFLVASLITSLSLVMIG